MSTTITSLHQKRENLIEQIRSLKDFRRGTITIYSRVCGKPTCRCAQDDSSKHDQFLWTASIDGKTRSKHLHPGPEVAKYLEETERFLQFKNIIEQPTLVNERIANARHPATLDNSDALDALKKNCGNNYRGHGKGTPARHHHAD